MRGRKRGGRATSAEFNRVRDALARGVVLRFDGYAFRDQVYGMKPGGEVYRVVEVLRAVRGGWGGVIVQDAEVGLDVLVKGAQRQDVGSMTGAGA